MPLPGFGADLLLADGVAAGGGGFSPANLSPAGWWDFTDAAHVLEGAGDPVETNDDLVSQVDDLSANGHHLIQPTSGNRPLWKSAGYVEFPGTDEYLQVNAPGFSINPFEIYIVAEELGTNNYQGLVMFGRAAEGNDYDSPAALSINTRAGSNLVGVECNWAGADVGGFGQLPKGVVRVSATGSTIGVALNNGTLSTGSSTPDSTHVGPFRVGARMGPGDYLYGRVFDIVLFGNLLSSGDRADLLDYLYDKHGITP